jgi:hypothetical protein
MLSPSSALFTVISSTLGIFSLQIGDAVRDSPPIVDVSLKLQLQG